MSIHRCIRCDNPIDYDVTDWCDVCDMSIFDDRMVKPKKMLTIQNISLLEGTQYNSWLVDSVLEDVYRYDKDLNIIEPKCYSISLVSRGLVHRGNMLLERQQDGVLKGKYRFELWLNKKKFIIGSLTKKELEDKDKVIQSIVNALDFELLNK